MNDDDYRQTVLNLLGAEDFLKSANVDPKEIIVASIGPPGLDCLHTFRFRIQRNSNILNIDRLYIDWREGDDAYIVSGGQMQGFTIMHKAEETNVPGEYLRDALYRIAGIPIGHS